MTGGARGLCLGIETSCDETAAAVLAGGTRVLGEVVASQAGLHAKYGGVVPEVAARRHLETVLPVVAEAMSAAGAAWEDLSVVAVTRGPGLPAALLVGVATAKALAYAHGLPLVGVNHLAGHIHALMLDGAAAEGLPRPSVCLVVSGSHTDLCLLPADGGLRLLGATADDAAGEAFDKAARLLGLGYPGGPAIDRLAAEGDAGALPLPRAMGPAGPDGNDLAFSFSGLKTALAQALRQHAAAAAADAAASFQAAVVEVLVGKTMRAVDRYGVRHVLACGGVTANRGLRAALHAACAERGLELRIPPLRYCTDNAAMIAAAGWAAWTSGRSDGWDLDAVPGLSLDL